MKRIIAAVALAAALGGCTVNLGGGDEPEPTKTFASEEEKDTAFLAELARQNIHVPDTFPQEVDLPFLARDICKEVREAGSVKEFFRDTVTENPNLLEEDRDFIASLTAVGTLYYCPEVRVQ